MADENCFAKILQSKITANARENDARCFAKIVYFWKRNTYLQFKKSPRSFEKLMEDFEKYFEENIYAIIPHHEVIVWCQDAIFCVNIFWVYSFFFYVKKTSIVHGSLMIISLQEQELSLQQESS